MQVNLVDGRQCDQYTITDDFVHLSHNSGVFLHDDLLAVLAVRCEMSLRIDISVVLEPAHGSTQYNLIRIPDQKLRRLMA